MDCLIKFDQLHANIWGDIVAQIMNWFSDFVVRDGFWYLREKVCDSITGFVYSRIQAILDSILNSHQIYQNLWFNMKFVGDPEVTDRNSMFLKIQGVGIWKNKTEFSKGIRKNKAEFFNIVLNLNGSQTGIQ